MPTSLDHGIIPANYIECRFNGSERAQNGNRPFY